MRINDVAKRIVCNLVYAFNPADFRWRSVCLRPLVGYLVVPVGIERLTKPIHNNPTAYNGAPLFMVIDNGGCGIAIEIIDYNRRARLAIEQCGLVLVKDNELSAARQHAIHV